jgi:5'-AMP-activated protein kinase catalytic alpha subunit
VLFAFLSGFLPFEDPNTGKLYKKILAADYQLPDHVSDKAADLIARILTTDPEKRITIAQIKKHPWFNLVEYTLPKQPGTFVGKEVPPFDLNILKKLEISQKIKPDYTIKCLEANNHNSVTASYFLLLKQHLKSGGTSVADARIKTYDKTIFIKMKLDIINEKSSKST